MFLDPEASQESLKRPKKAPKRNPKTSKTPNKKIQNWAQKLTISWRILDMGIKHAQKISQKYDNTKNKNIRKVTFLESYFGTFWSHLKPVFGHILDQNLGGSF